MTLILRIFLFLFIIIALALSSFPSNSSGTSYTVEKKIDETRVVEDMDHDAYFIMSEDSKFEAKVEVIEGNKVDFYLFKEEQYSQYTNIFAIQFEYQEKDENSRSASWGMANDVYVLVVDNDFHSDSGAFPDGNVTYRIKITVSELSFFERYFDLPRIDHCDNFHNILVVYTSKKIQGKCKIIKGEVQGEALNGFSDLH